MDDAAAHRAAAGKAQLELLHSDQSCSALAVEKLQNGCREMGDVEQSRLAVHFTNCHLAKSGLATYECSATMSIEACTKPMVDSPASLAYTAYTHFYTHAESMCFYLQVALLPFSPCPLPHAGYHRPARLCATVGTAHKTKHHGCAPHDPCAPCAPHNPRPTPPRLAVSGVPAVHRGAGRLPRQLGPRYGRPAAAAALDGSRDEPDVGADFDRARGGRGGSPHPAAASARGEAAAGRPAGAIPTRWSICSLAARSCRMRLCFLTGTAVCVPRTGASQSPGVFSVFSRPILPLLFLDAVNPV